MYLQINEAVDSSKFADFFKSADITVAFSKVNEKKKKKNCRPISILPLTQNFLKRLF